MAHGHKGFAVKGTSKHSGKAGHRKHGGKRSRKHSKK